MSTSFSEVMGLEAVSLPDRFSQLLRTHRERIGLSREEMSVCCGLELDMWAALENCQVLDPSWTVLKRVAAALEMDPGSLLVIAILSEGARRQGLRSMHTYS
jgi:transcriptional regulator with XRE-family HTH domain